MQNHPALGGGRHGVVRRTQADAARPQFKEVITGPGQRAADGPTSKWTSPRPGGATAGRRRRGRRHPAAAVTDLGPAVRRLRSMTSDELDTRRLRGHGWHGRRRQHRDRRTSSPTDPHERATATGAAAIGVHPVAGDHQPRQRSADAEGRALRRPTRGSRPLIDALVAKRLLVKDTRDGEVVVEVALESLLRQWDELAGWLREERQNLKAADDVERNATAWATNDHDPAWLLTGTRLADAETLSTTDEFGDRLAGTRDYVTASRAAEDARLAAEEEHRLAALRHAQERQQTAEAHAVTTAQAVPHSGRRRGHRGGRRGRGHDLLQPGQRREGASAGKVPGSHRAASELRSRTTCWQVQTPPVTTRAFIELLAARTLGGALDEGALLEAVVRRATTQKIIDTDAVANAVAFSGRRVASAEARWRRYGCGTPTPASQSVPRWPGTRAGCSAWRSAPTGDAAGAAQATTARCGCGTPTPANRSALH